MMTALPMWTAKEFQTFRRHYSQGKESFAAINCRYDRLLPWIIKNQGSAPTYVYLVKKDGSQAIDIAGLLSTSNASHGGVDYCFFEGALDLNQATDCNKFSWDGSSWNLIGDSTWPNFVEDGAFYYLEFSFGGTKYWSELIRISDFPEFASDPTGCNGMVRIECASACAVGGVPPLGGQKLFIDGETSDAEYSLEREVATDGNNDETSVWVKSKKRYTVKFYAIETVADFVSTIPLYSVVNITDQTGFQTAVTDVDFQITWPQDQGGALALVELSYAVQYINQTHCC